MPDYNTTAIVLRRMAFGETDNILTLYSRERGRLSAIAKGARKAISRLSGATELLTCARYALASGKSLEVVRQAEVLSAYSGLRQDLSRLAHGLYAADLVQAFTADSDPNEQLFDLLADTLSHTEKTKTIDSLARWYELKLLSELGYAAELRSCVYCRTPLPGSFSRFSYFGMSSSQGGALCPPHAHPDRFDDHSLLSYDGLVHLQRLSEISAEDDEGLNNLPVPPTEVQDQVRLNMRRYIRYRLDRDLRSIAFLDSLRDTAETTAQV